MKNERVKIWDILLIAGIVAVCFVLWFFPKPSGDTVAVSVDGQTVYRGSLHTNRVVELESGTRVVIRDGKAWVEDARCPDLLCEEMGKISSAGQVILCVPRNISVEIFSGEVDGIAG